MEKKIEKKDAEVVITLTASADEWKQAQKKEENKRIANINVPGFRKGHVPYAIAKQRINPVQVMNDAMYDLVNKFYAEVLQEEKLNPFMQPQLKVEKFSQDELVAQVVVALFPKVELGEYKNLGIKMDDVKVSDDEIQAMINKDLEQHANLVLKEGAAKNGDTVTIDFKGYVDNAPFDGGEAKNYELKIGSGSFIPGFEDALIGLKAGDEKEISIKFPENYVENLANKDAKFEVKVHEVKKTVLPELNDEFVDELELPNVKGVDSYKANVAYACKANKQKEVQNKFLDAIVKKAVENSKATIADQIVEDEANNSIKQIKDQIDKSGLTYEDFLKLNGQTEEQFVNAKKEEARNNIKSMLVIDEICRKENIVVDSAALNAKYLELAKQYSMKVEDVKKALEKQQNELLSNLKNELFTKFILSANNGEIKEDKAEAPTKAEGEAKPAAKKTTSKSSSAAGEKKTTSTTAKKATTTTAKKTTSTTAKKTTTKKAE